MWKKRNSAWRLMWASSPAVVALIASNALASDVWTGGSSTTDNWSDPANWGGVLPVAGDSLVFAGTTQLTPNDDFAASTLFDGLTINSGAGAFIIGGNSITLGGSIVDNSTTAENINLPLIVNSTQIATVVSGGTLTLGGAISGAGGLTSNGAGTLILSTANSYGGGTTIGGGLVEATNASAFGSNTVTVQSGGEAEVGTSAALTTLTNSFNISGNGPGTGSIPAALALRGTLATGVITVNGSARIGDGGFGDTISTQITSTGAGNLEFYSQASGTSTFTISNTTNNWAGTTTVTNASNTASIATILKLGASNVFPSTSQLILNATSTGLAEFDMAGRSPSVAGLSSTGTASNDQVIDSNTSSAITLTSNLTGSATFGGSIIAPTGTATIAFTKSGTGMQTLAGANTYNGTTTISAGTLSVTGSLLSTGTVTLNAATLAGTGSLGNVTMNNSSAVINPGATGAGSVGTLTVNSLVSKGGILQFDLSNAAVPSSNDSITVNGATTFSSGSPKIAPTAGEAAGTYTVLSSTGGITYTVTPTLTTPAITGRAQTFMLVTNPTNIQVVVTGGAANLVWAGGVLTANGADGTTWDNLHGTGAGASNDQNWNNSGTQDFFYDGDSVTFNDTGSPNQSVNLTTTVSPSAVNFNSTRNYSISGSGSIAGLGSLSLNGSGSVTLSTANTYSGGTTINNGTVNANAPSVFGTGPITINGGTIDNTSSLPITLSTNNAQTWAGNFAFTGSSNLNLGSGAVTLSVTPTVTVNNNTLTVSGNIGGNFGLNKAGAGTLVLAGTNTYTGATNITAGTVVVTNSNSLGSLSGAGITINGGTLDVGGDPTANNFLPAGLSFTIAGTGAGGVGAVTNSNPTVTQFNAFRGANLSLSADALITGNRIDIGRALPATLNLNGHTLTLSMSGSQPMFGIETDATVTAGNIVVAQGTLDIEQSASVLDTAGTSKITFNNGANAQFFQTTANTTTRPMIFLGNNTIGSGGGSVGATVNSPVTLMGNVTMEAVTNGIPALASVTALTLAGNISESGGSYSVTTAGASTTTLSGTNNWSGGTNIQSGTLQMGSTGALPTATAVTFGDASGDSGVLDLNGNSSTIGALSVAAGAGASNIIGNSGAAPSTLIFAGGTSNYSGVIQNTLGAGSATVALNIASGSLTLAGANTYTGNTHVTGGALTLASSGTIASANITADAATSANINGLLTAPSAVTANGNVTFGAADGVNGAITNHILTRNVGALTVGSAGVVALAAATDHTARQVLVASSLSNTAGLINLSNNDMLVQNGNITDISNQLKSGFNAGGTYWSGATGIVSTSAAADTSYLTTLGYRQSDGTSFDGVNTTTNDVLVKYTYYGDANLDGSVNGADYQQIDNGFGSHLTGWSNGDFNYDGIVDGSDYSLIDNTFNQINATGASPLAIVAGAVSSVPEPTTLGLLSIGAMSLFGRRRRRHA